MNKTPKANDVGTESAPKHKHRIKISKRALVYIVGTIYVVALFWLIGSRTNSQSNVYINNTKFSVRLATTAQQRDQGLSGTSKLGSNDGMLFVFPNSGSYGFWMKEMNYNLDIIWISANKKVVSDYENLSPSSYPTVFYPTQSAKYVLEVDSGTSQRLNIHDGTTVSF